MDGILKNIFQESEEVNIVDVFNKKKYSVLKHFDFLLKISTIKETFFAEIPMFPSNLVVDYDSKEVGNVVKNLYNFDTISNVVLSYVTALNNILNNPPEKYVIVVSTKQPRLIDASTIKHGFHLQFVSILLTKEVQKKVNSEAKKICLYNNNLDDVVGKPWLTYGSKKSPNEDSYIAEYGLNAYDNKIEKISLEDIFVDITYNDIKITNTNLKQYLPSLLSLRNGNIFNNFQKYYTEKNQVEQIKMPKCFEPTKTEYITLSDEKVGDLVMTLNKSRAENYNDWIKVAMVLTSIAQKSSNKDFLKSIFMIFSSQSTTNYNRFSCEEKWDNLMNTCNGSLGLGTLIHMAKEDGLPDLKKILFNFSLEKIPIHDIDIIEMVSDTITDKYITHKDYGCFKFQDTVWVDIIGWENIFKKYIETWSKHYIPKIKSQLEQTDLDDDIVKSYRKSINLLERKIKNYTPLNSLSKTLFDYYYSNEVVNLQKPNKQYFAFSNCVFDINSWSLVNPDPDHLIYNKIDHELIEWDKVPEKNKKFVEDFFIKVFPDEELRNYTLNNFARLFTGQNTHKQFQLWTGVGNNGKSVCISMLEYVFGKMCMKIPKSTVLGQSQKMGSVCPELFRLKDSRIAIIDEVTNNDYLDPGQIKGLSGNDKLYGRDLYQKSKDITEIEPMFVPIIITNETPIIKKPDDATWNRIRLIRFESIFKSNPVEYAKNNPNLDPTKIFKSDPKINFLLQKNAKYIVSYLMNIIFQYDSFESFNEEEIIPRKVREGLENFKLGQNIMKQYLDENFVIDSNSEILNFQSLAKEYNATRPKVILSIEEVKSAINSFSMFKPQIVVTETGVKGLKRVMY